MCGSHCVCVSVCMCFFQSEGSLLQREMKSYMAAIKGEKRFIFMNKHPKSHSDVTYRCLLNVVVLFFFRDAAGFHQPDTVPAWGLRARLARKRWCPEHREGRNHKETRMCDTWMHLNSPHRYDSTQEAPHKQPENLQSRQDDTSGSRHEELEVGCPSGVEPVASLGPCKDTEGQKYTHHGCQVYHVSVWRVGCTCPQELMSASCNMSTDSRWQCKRNSPHYDDGPSPEPQTLTLIR